MSDEPEHSVFMTIFTYSLELPDVNYSEAMIQVERPICQTFDESPCETAHSQAKPKHPDSHPWL